MYFKYFLRAFVIASGCVFAQFVHAIDITTDIEADTTWFPDDNPHVVRKSGFRIVSGFELTIEPGVIVQFMNEQQINEVFYIDGSLVVNAGAQLQFDDVYAIEVNGSAKIRGTNGNPVSMTALNPLGAWRFIQFNDTSTAASYSGQTYVDGTILEYVVMDNCGLDGISGLPETEGCIQLDQSHPFINFVTVRNSSATGIHAININGDLRIHNCSIHDNNDDESDEAGGIYIQAAAASTAIVDITGNTIQNNSSLGVAGGIRVNDVALLTIQGNQILDNDLVVANAGAGGLSINNSNIAAISPHQMVDNTIGRNTSVQGGGGIHVNNSDVEIRNNRIERNNTSTGNGGGILLIDGTNALVQNNIISNNDAESAGGGIYVGNIVLSPLTEKTVTIQQNIVSGNRAINDNVGGINIRGGNITLTENIIADNVAGNTNAALRLSGAGVASQNSIVRNIGNASVLIDDPVDATASTNLSFNQNTVVDNITTAFVTISGVGDPLLFPIINNNNFWNNGGGYYVSNSEAGVTPIDATNNYFGTAILADVEAEIDGVVTVDPILISPELNAPVSPPVIISQQVSGDTVSFSWAPAVESDVTGYRVYWKNSADADYTLVPTVGDVGLATSFSYSGLNASLDYYFAVTAYDSGDAAVTDLANTITNEKQTGGTESWYSEAVVISRTAANNNDDDSGGGGLGVMLLALLAPLLMRKTRRS